MSSDRNKQSLHELSSKEEELVILRVEVSSAQEKMKGRTEEVSGALWDIYIYDVSLEGFLVYRKSANFRRGRCRGFFVCNHISTNDGKCGGVCYLL